MRRFSIYDDKAENSVIASLANDQGEMVPLIKAFYSQPDTEGKQSVRAVDLLHQCVLYDGPVKNDDAQGQIAGSKYFIFGHGFTDVEAGGRFCRAGQCCG